MIALMTTMALPLDNEKLINGKGLSEYLEDLLSADRKVSVKGFNCKSGRIGYKEFLESLPDAESVDLYSLRPGWYNAEGFLGVDFKGMSDGFRLAVFPNEDGTNSYFVDDIINERCVRTANITQEIFNTLKS